MLKVVNEPPKRRVIVVEKQERKSNGIGVAGFVLSLVSIFMSVFPLISCLLWFLGLLFSFIGLFKQPRGLAVAGFVISMIGVVIIVLCAMFIWAAILAAMGISGL